MPNYEDYSKRVILEKIAEEKRLEEFKKVIDRSFERAADKINEQIYLYLERVAKDNEVNIDAAKSLLNSKELKGFHLSLEEYIRLAKGPKSEEINKVLKNASNRIHISRLQALEMQKDAILAQLYDEFELTGRGVINAETVHGYGRMIKDLELIGNPPSMSSRISKNQILGLIDKSWGLGAWNYGAQVYSQYKKTRKVLQEELIQNALGVQSIKQTADNVSKRLLISANNADVLVRTEVTANKSKVEKEQMIKDGIYGYMIQAVLDSRTSRKCRMMDHMKFKTEDHQTGVTAPPFHPRCRTVIVKIKNKSDFDTITAKDISPTRSVRDPITGKTYITDNVSYPEWGKEVAEKVKSAKKASSGYSDKIYPITDKVINSVKVPEISSLNEKEIERIRENMQNILIESRDNNNSKEVAYLYNLGKNDLKKNYGSANRIELGVYEYDVMIHNHPNNEYFSNMDLIYFASTKTKIMGIVKHNGETAFLEKTDDFNAMKFLTVYKRLEKKYSRIIEQDVQKGYNKVVEELLKKIKGINRY